MKSFFKKLAFVMAMAMVVSLAAPAAAQADELKPLYLALQGTEDEVTAITIAPDKTDLDFCFKGAQSGWLALLKESEGWKSSNPAVATVDGEGKVTPVAEGDTVISYQLKGYEVAEATVTVKAEEVVTPDEPEVEVPDVSVTVLDTKTVEIYAGAGTSKVKEEDVELYRVFSSAVGDPVEVFWPIDVFTPNTTNDTVKVSPFVQYKDGEHYRLYIKGVEDPVDIYIVIPELEEITHVEVTWGSNEDKDDKVAVVAGVGQDNPVYLSYKIMFGSMDVTNMFEEDVDIEFVLKSPSEDSADAKKFEWDPDEGVLVFDEKVEVVIETLASFVNEKGEDVFRDTNPVRIVPTELPEYGFDKVVAWTIWDGTSEIKATNWYTTQTDVEDVAEIPAGVNDKYSIVLKVVDAYGDEWVTDEDAAKKCKPTAAKWIGDSFLADSIWFEYKSTNTDKFLVDSCAGGFDEPAYLTTYTGEKQAIAYVELHQDNEEDPDNTLVDTVYAFRFRIGEEKKFDNLKITGTTNISADAIYANENKSYIETTITVTPSYQTKYGGQAFEVEGAKYEVTCSDPDGKGVWTMPAEADADGKITIKFNGAALYKATGRTSLTYTVREKTHGISNSFTITLDKPNWRDASREYDKPNGVTSFLSTLKDEEIMKKVNGTLVGTGKYKYELLIDQDGGFDKLALTAVKKTVNLGDHTGASDKSSTAFVASATFKASITSGEVKVGDYKGGNFAPLTANWKEATGYSEGQRLYGVYNANEELLLTSATTGDLYNITTPSSNSFNVQLTWTDGDEVHYAPAGSYKFRVYTVTDVDANGKIKDYAEAYATFEVKDTVKKLTFNNRENISTSINAVTDDETLKDIIIEAFSFKLGDNVWNLAADEKAGSVIVGIKKVANDDYVIIQEVKFHVPVDGTTSLGWKTSGTDLVELAGEDYYVQTVKINMSVQLGVDPDAE